MAGEAEAAGEGRVVLIPALIGAVLSIVFNRTGFLGFLFLLPIAVVAFCYNFRSAQACAGLTVLGNGVLSLGMAWVYHLPTHALLPDILYFVVIMLLFTWIVAPGSKAAFHLTTAYRAALGSLIGAIALLLVLRVSGEETGLYSMLKAQADALVSLYKTSAGPDVVEQTMAEAFITTENILDFVKNLSLRGGAVLSCLFLFFLTRQLGAAIFVLVRRVRPNGNFMYFHAAPWMIWALSLSLLAVLLGTSLKLSWMEIAAWNILAVCVMFYLAQGAGILMFLFARWTITAGMRLLINFLTVIVIFSPGINLAFLAVLILLGVAENWAPFRIIKTNGPSSTPGKGE
ncbi:MAG: hypothetical protein LBT16_14725 [Treponema sp.]|jgi:hypothetical protein|nr:hypothetical protein [Treponema sp.]